MIEEKPQDHLQLINSDERILVVLNETNDYYDNNIEIAKSINECIWIWRSLSSLLPQTVEKFWSGHTFPLVEAEYEIESSVELCKFGFYKHAIAALRNSLELGLLSVYWDIDDRGHINIKQWLNSREATPFLRRIVFPKLKLNGNIKKFDELHNIFAETSNIYEKLCNYQHTKGIRFSSRALSRANYNTFNEPALKAWRNHEVPPVSLDTKEG